jgi:hypothetical protein
MLNKSLFNCKALFFNLAKSQSRKVFYFLCDSASEQITRQLKKLCETCELDYSVSQTKDK